MSSSEAITWPALLLLLVVGCTAPLSGDTVGGASEAIDLRAAVPTFDGDIQVYDGPGELAASVDAVVRATIEDVSPGRRIVFDPVNVPDDVTETVVFQVAIDEIISGDLGGEEVVYVEVHVTEEVDIEAVRRAVPDDAVLFLTELSDSVDPGVAVEEAGRGRPPGSRLFGVSPAGFLYLTGAELEDLHVELEELPGSWADLDSLDEVEDNVAASDAA